MPYTWSDTPSYIAADASFSGAGRAPLRLDLLQHNSLGPKGFVLFFGITCILMCVPLMAFFGSVFWYGILGYLGLTLAGAWWALKSSWKHGAVSEVLEVWSDHLRLTRRNPDGSVKGWDANPFWVRVVTHDTEGPVPHYVTLCGAGRDVEIGAFLSEDERKELSADLRGLLNDLRTNI
ncbi:MAG: DUF2244 domain-containing protein [Planktomarina sp.]